MSEASYAIPNRLTTADGKTRRVGFEVEFAGIAPEKVAEIVAAEYDGQVEKISEAEYLVSTSNLKDFKVELDWGFGKSLARRNASSTRQSVDMMSSESLMEWMTKIASVLVPVEIVCPPINIDNLTLLDPLIRRLREEGAEGTDQSFLYAFGVHLNPEIPDLEAECIIRYLQGFVVSQSWLLEKHNVDFSRRITPYIDLFPLKYEQLVVAYTGNEGIERLLADYLEHNSTRNRAMDMLPLFKHLRPDIIDKAMATDQVNARPTIHYRLPNCEIEKPEWSLSHSWNIWSVVEKIASEDGLRTRLINQWRQHQSDSTIFKEQSWHQELNKIYQDLLLA